MLKYQKFSFIIFFFIFCFLLPAYGFTQPKSKIVLYPAPRGETLSKLYHVSVNGRPLAVYLAKVAMGDNKQRFKAVDDLLNSANYYDTAAFAYFDMRGAAIIRVSINNTITKAKILPASAEIKIKKYQRYLTFTVTKPQDITLEINGEVIKSLHVFINAIQATIPNANDPNVVFFGPGIHEVSNLIIGDNKTVYIAGGAIVRAMIGKDEKYNIEPSGLKNYEPRLFLSGKNIRLCGRGIIDAGLCPTHAGNFIVLKGSNIAVEGVIIRNSCGWTVPIRQSTDILIDNIKILGYRANSDGIDICNSTNVIVKNCFIRTNDDLIVIKTEKGEGVARHIVVKNCVLYNQLANALSLGAELRENVNDVLFSDCDIIHDIGRAWSLHIFQSDSSLVSNIRFENLRIEEAHQFISLWIGHDVASYTANAGRIQGVTFKNIEVMGSPLNIDLVGVDSLHAITNVLFQKVWLNHKPLLDRDIKNNSFVKNIQINN